MIILISVAGLVAFFGLGRAEDPPFTVKQMTVITVWPGATAQEMQDQVAEPLENDSELKWYDRTETYTRRHSVDHPVAAGSDPAFRGAGAVLSGAQKLGDEAKTCLPASPAR